MRVIVFVFLYFKSAVLFLQLNGDVNIHVNIIGLVFVIFYIAVAEFTQAIDKLALPVNHGKNTDIIFLAYFKVVGAKCRCGMNDTGTIFSGHKIAKQDAKRFSAGCDLTNNFQ